MSSKEHMIDRLRSIKRTVLGSSGTRIYSQFGEDLLLRTALDSFGITSPTYLDIGAYDPKELSNTYYFYERGASGVCVEPNPSKHALFLKLRERDVCLNVGLGGKASGEADYYLMSKPFLNTFSKEEAEKCEKEGFAIEAKIKIPLLTINQVIKEHCQKVPDFVSLDVEGMDIDILQHLDWDAYRPVIFCIETLSFAQDRKERVKDQSILELMREKGYVVFADTYVNTIFVDGGKW